ncbi:MAG: flavin reductase family protein [Candidatus Bathyarchaeota archaeon]|nr:flavin reductase family protein [Candidatus Bathyarchaeota archaeon]
MNKVKRGSQPAIYPIPICLMGANVDGKPTYGTLGDIGIVGFNPGVVFCASQSKHYTNKGVKENKTFSVNFPNLDMIEVTDYCGIVSGKNVDKGALFTNFYGNLGTAPMIEECPINLECKLIKTMQVNNMDMFIGEVTESYVTEKIDTGEPGKWPSLKAVNPVIYGMDRQYWSIGEPVAKGFDIGRKLLKR